MAEPGVAPGDSLPKLGTVLTVTLKCILDFFGVTDSIIILFLVFRFLSPSLGILSA